MPYGTVNADLMTTSDGVSSSGLYGFKNRIINGAMVIDQRNAGASVSQSNAYGYINDRWWVYQPNVGTAQRVSTGNSDFPYALRVQRTAANTGTTIVTAGQVIETNNCQDLAGQTITVSAYLTAGANFSAASSQVYISVITGTGTDQGAFAGFGSASWTGWANTLASATTISTTRTKYSASVTIPAGTNEIGLRVYWYPTGTAGAADYVDITGVQLEKGSVATSFDYRPYGTELALCQRYFYKHNTSWGSSYNSSNSTLIGYPFKVTMRAQPTMDSGAAFSVNTGSAGTPTVFAGTGTGTDGNVIYVYNSASNWTTAAVIGLNAGFSAEL